jgi:hypothetical protein
MLNSLGCSDSRLERELRVNIPIGRGRSKGAKLVQELLAVNRINVAIDGDFGDATARALAAFCQREGIAIADKVDQGLMDRLAQPLLRAIRPVSPTGSLGNTIVAMARQQVAEHPIELGGANSGPWVRLYMNGSEGRDFLWCAGFITYIIRAAAKAEGTASPVTRTFSCDAIGHEAKNKGSFRKRSTSAQAVPGSVFLVPHSTHAADWIHTGIITGGDGSVFQTIEGNTNSGGSRNGVEACARSRACRNVDVVLL